MTSTTRVFITALGACTAMHAARAHTTTAVVDDFQPGLVATAGPGGSRSVVREAVLGGERDLLADDTTRTFVWDGQDGDPTSVDHTGLGGVDLTGHGFYTQLALELGDGARAASGVLTIYTDQDRASQIGFDLPEAGALTIALADLAPALGDGVDLRDVGSIELALHGADALAVELDRLVLVSSLGVRTADAATGPGVGGQVDTAAVVAVTPVVIEGDMPPGGGGEAVDIINAPFTNGAGQVGFTGSLGNGDRFVWFDSGITFLASSALPTVLNGGESTMGIGDGGEFAYSPSIDGDDGIWSSNGQVAIENVQAPGFPAGTTSTFHSRPTMLPDGRANWISAFNESGGTSSQGRILYTAKGPLEANTAVVLRSDDIVAGLPIDRPSGVDFDYGFSRDFAHQINVLLLDTGSTANDGVVYVDGAVVARESFKSGEGDNWDNFDYVSINNDGHYLFSGDTDGTTSSDEFIAYDGSIVLREGDTLGSVTLSGSVNALSLNNLGQCVFTWGSGANEALFFAADASNPRGTAIPILRVGEMVDLDGNSTGDATVTDFNASGVVGPGLWLAEDGRVHFEVDLDDGVGTPEAILTIDLPDDFVAYCPGDGSGAPCPCSNSGDTGKGCDNSLGTGGALLTGTGSAAANDVVLHGSSLPPTTVALAIRSTAQAGGGAGTPFGDGLLCLEMPTTRLVAGTASDGIIALALNHGAGAGTFFYQLWYRNNQLFCTPERYNLTNGLAIVWP